MINIAICDDNREIVETIHKIVSEFFKSQNIETQTINLFNNGISLINDSQIYDIVFLDIEMPDANGLSIGQKLIKKNPKTILIITTSHIEYLDDAMRMNVFRYIPKPINSKSVVRNLSDALAKYNIIQAQTMLIATEAGTIRFNTDDIIMLELIDRKVTVYTKTNKFTTTKTLKEWLNILPPTNFYMCHRSYIINLSHVYKLTSDKLIMDIPGIEAYIPKRKHAEILRILNEYTAFFC